MAGAQTQAEPVAMSFGAARQQMAATSGALASAGHGVRASEDQAAALKALNRPVISGTAQLVEYQKTLSIDLTGGKDRFAENASDYLADLPGQFPPEFQAIVSQVSGRIEQALPGLLDAIPDALSFRTRDTIFRPTVTAALPLYSGGAIPAIQRGALAGVALARAQAAGAQSLADVRLVQLYFGQQLAEQLLLSTTQTRDALDRHLANARIMEREGVLPHVRTLQVEVARNTAERARIRAQLELRTASEALARYLDVEGQGVQPTTPLFVNSQPLAPVDDYIASATDQHPQVRAAQAGEEIARAGVDLARSRYLPQAYAFGEYNLDRGNALPVEPDWIVGVGVRYTFLSNIDRAKTLSAAQEREQAAAQTGREARKLVAMETSRAWDLVDTARQSFLLLDGNIKAAQENLRVQEISFREGEGTVADVIDAQAALATARTERIAAAYEYDVALAALLAATNRSDEFASHLARGDRVVAP